MQCFVYLSVQPTKQLAETLRLLTDRDHCVFSSSDLAAAVPESNRQQLPVLLSRATKSGILTRICRGIYFHPVADYPRGNLLFHAAARLRAGEMNYLSLETVLSEAGVISQIPMNWISVMTSGRSHVVDCGDFGRIEFVHTEQRANDLEGRIFYNPARRLWTATVELAMRDVRRTRRNLDLINEEVLHELV